MPIKFINLFNFSPRFASFGKTPTKLINLFNLFYYKDLPVNLGERLTKFIKLVKFLQDPLKPTTLIILLTF